MDKPEAQQLLHEVLKEYRVKKHDELVALIQSPAAFEVAGPTGTEYQIEIQAFWDDPRKEGGDLRMLGSIDDGRFPYAFVPLTAGFIIQTDGTIVGD